MPGNMVLGVIMVNKLLTLIGLILGAIAILYPLPVVINSYWSLILPTAANGFGIFLMRQYVVINGCGGDCYCSSTNPIFYWSEAICSGYWFNGN
jgi:hypothetical protein